MNTGEFPTVVAMAEAAVDQPEADEDDPPAADTDATTAELLMVSKVAVSADSVDEKADSAALLLLLPVDVVCAAVGMAREPLAARSAKRNPSWIQSSSNRHIHPSSVR